MSYKLFISIAAAVLLAGCTAWEAGLPEPRVFQASVEDPGTKTYLDNGAGTLQMFWTRGDAVSVFCADGSGKYLFDGDTGSDHGPLRPDTDAGLSGRGALCHLLQQFATSFDIDILFKHRHGRFHKYKKHFADWRHSLRKD